MHAMLLLDQVLNAKLDKPFVSIPPEVGIPALQEHELVGFFIQPLIESEINKEVL